MSDNDKIISKEMLLFMIEKKLGAFNRHSNTEYLALTSDVVGKEYQNILKYVSSQEEK